jgi:hypothetical protein
MALHHIAGRSKRCMRGVEHAAEACPLSCPAALRHPQKRRSLDGCPAFLPPGPSPPQDYLPPALHDTFMRAVAEFVWLPWRAAMEAEGVEGAAQGGSQVCGQPRPLPLE